MKPRVEALVGERVRVKSDGRMGTIVGANNIGEDPNQLVKFDDDGKTMMVRLSLLEMVAWTTSARPK